MTETPTEPAQPGGQLREPANRVSPRAVSYWRLTAFLGALVEWAVLGVGYAFLPGRPWWVTALLVALVLPSVVHLAVMPTLRYRVHRWEVTPTAVHTRAGWLTIEQRIAPLSRVQTVDSQQGALMRLFRLASLTVTTASAAGPITIACLDADVAHGLVAELTAITSSTTGDAT
ncbi:PH domain-containing protein [Nocardioides speluncae]|uniref:PH domain-containing protein n=1 Tax=Nocardioides speluncae TaxID=2670337 RepID=UPI000D69706A|nr:PH domain-containing protein [Nocardioides speluncae]